MDDRRTFARIRERKILRALKKNPDGMYPAELSRLTETSSPTIRRILGKLMIENKVEVKRKIGTRKRELAIIYGLKECE